jgi:hypothetical protein
MKAARDLGDKGMGADWIVTNICAANNNPTPGMLISKATVLR